MKAHTSSDVLQHKLAAVRRKLVATAVITGAALTFTGFFVFLAVNVALDWWLELSRVARALLLLVDFVVLAWIYLTQVIRPMMRPPDDADIALWIEQRAPELHSRLISAVQLSQNQGDARSTELVEALIAETEQIAAPIDFSVAVPAAPMFRMCGIALIVCLAGIQGYRETQPEIVLYLKRAFLASIPAPRKTQVSCLTGNKTIALGDSLELEAIATGVLPSAGYAFLQQSPREIQTVTLLPRTNAPSHFHQTLNNVQTSFTYTIQLNDGVTPSYRIDVQPRPAVATLSCEQQFPEYTRLGPVSRRPNDLRLLIGSRLCLKASSTKPLQSATVWLEGLHQQIPMAIDPQTHTNLTATIPIATNALTGFFIRLTDNAGLSSKDEVTYRVDMVPDTPPTVRITFPSHRDELATTNAQMLLGFEANDDYGIADVRLHKKVGEHESVSELNIEEQLPRTLKRRHEWNIAELTPPPREGTVIEYWLEIRDANTVSGPGVAFSEHYFVRVASSAEKRADLLSRFDQTLQTVGTASKEQENLNQRLGELIMEKRPTP